ncbi:MAG: hypothetical protein SFU56_07265 [Capsulimonadales bacterium]|nr:hypothetical protein [Capsulimonadales bacterium]
MRILFGPEQDGLHIAPDAPGGYEWWYFDALSDDGKYALVVIFFLGAPMSPYYRAVVDSRGFGRTPPSPNDWCAVFVSLHEIPPPSVVFTTNPHGARKRRSAEERAYAYNLYRDGRFAADGSEIVIGDSRMCRTVNDGWRLSLTERCLWFGRITADIEFAPTGDPIAGDPFGRDDDHTWVCVAPHCRVTASVRTADGQTIDFPADGYHDHNFGTLPWAGGEDAGWFWARGHLSGENGERTTAIVYTHTGEPERFLLTHRAGSPIRITDAARSAVTVTYRNPYGLDYRLSERFEQPESGEVFVLRCNAFGDLLRGPFYGRWVVEISGTDEKGAPLQGKGIAEAFRPSRLCHPIWSRLMRTRFRRRS